MVSTANHIRKKWSLKNNKIQSNCGALPTVTLPWISSLSPKLRKIFRKVGYRVVFKSNPKLGSLLICKNKSELPHNSQPGSYFIEYNCSKRYKQSYKLELELNNIKKVKKKF